MDHKQNQAIAAAKEGGRIAIEGSPELDLASSYIFKKLRRSTELKKMI